jgi:hypothetical protein
MRLTHLMMLRLKHSNLPRMMPLNSPLKKQQNLQRLTQQKLPLDLLRLPPW